MNILKEADLIVNERSQEKERQYGSFDESMAKAAEFASLLTNKNITIEDCTNQAYMVIKGRTGKMVNNTFIKD